MQRTSIAGVGSLLRSKLATKVALWKQGWADYLTNGCWWCAWGCNCWGCNRCNEHCNCADLPSCPACGLLTYECVLSGCAGSVVLKREERELVMSHLATLGTELSSRMPGVRNAAWIASFVRELGVSANFMMDRASGPVEITEE